MTTRTSSRTFTLTLFVMALVGLAFGTAQAVLLRRIALDGTEGMAAPVAELADTDGLIYLIHHVPTPMLELFPTAKKPSRGTIIVCPGGGYRSLAITHEGYNVAKKLNEFGFDAAVLIYHLRADNEPRDEARNLAFTNALVARSLLQKRGGEFGLSTQKLGIIGFSAGGHLAARLTHAVADSTPLDFVALIYSGQIEKDGKVLDEFAPVKTPAFVCVAANDTNSSPSAIAYVEACKEKNVPCEFYMPANGGHGFGIRSSQPMEVKDWPEKLRTFLDALK